MILLYKRLEVDFILSKRKRKKRNFYQSSTYPIQFNKNINQNSFAQTHGFLFTKNLEDRKEKL